MSHVKDPVRAYICVALVCVVVLLIIVWEAATKPHPPRTTQKTKDAIAKLQSEVNDLKAAVGVELAEEASK